MFFIISISIAVFIAIKQGRRAKIAEQKNIELEKAMISYKYLKELAFTHYYNGKYEESLDVFKKYLLNNKDDKEWVEIINHIFRKETENIFSDSLLFTENSFPNYILIIQAFISSENKYSNSSPYPDIIKTLLNDYYLTFERTRYNAEFLIFLLDKSWEKAKNIIQYLNFQNEEIGVLFKEYLIQYLNKKLGIVDDIPF